MSKVYFNTQQFLEQSRDKYLITWRLINRECQVVLALLGDKFLFTDVESF